MFEKEMYTIEVESNKIDTQRNYIVNIRERCEVFNLDDFHKKSYINAWNFLETYLTPQELYIASVLTDRAFANANSLSLPNDDNEIIEMAKTFDVSKNIFKKILEKLFNCGIYGCFEGCNANQPNVKNWKFNPYLSSDKKIIKSDIAGLFQGTHCAKAYKTENYTLTDKHLKELTTISKVIKKHKKDART